MDFFFLDEMLVGIYSSPQSVDIQWRLSGRHVIYSVNLTTYYSNACILRLHSRISGVGPRGKPAHQLFRRFSRLLDFENQVLEGVQTTYLKDVLSISPHSKYSICQKRILANLALKPKSINLQIMHAFFCPHAFACHEHKHTAKRGCFISPGASCTL